MEEHNRNALAIAHWLQKHPKVTEVLHPGLDSHPQHELALRQMSGFGGTFSFRLAANREAIFLFLAGLQLFTLAESLGGVESLIGHPASMTHASIPREDRLKNGLKDSLIRLSVGVENAKDLTDDMAQAIG